VVGDAGASDAATDDDRAGVFHLIHRLSKPRSPARGAARQPPKARSPGR
jgi:hypothetical protein